MYIYTPGQLYKKMYSIWSTFFCCLGNDDWLNVPRLHFLRILLHVRHLRFAPMPQFGLKSKRHFKKQKKVMQHLRQIYDKNASPSPDSERHPITFDGR